MALVPGFVQRAARRYRGVAAVLAGTAVALYGVAQYAQHRWSEFRRDVELEQAAKANIKRRFEQNQRDCSYAIASMLSAVADRLFEAVNVEAIAQQLRQLRKSHLDVEQQIIAHSQAPDSDSPTRAASLVALQNTRSEVKLQQQQLLAELKVASFSRALTAIYLLGLLAVFSYLQLNLIGRLLYLDSIVNPEFPMPEDKKNSDAQADGSNNEGKSELPSKTAYSIETWRKAFQRPHTRTSVNVDTERCFLTFSWYVLNVGITPLVERVRHATELAVKDISVSAETSYDDFIEVLEKIRDEVEISDLLLDEAGKVRKSSDGSLPHNVMFDFKSLLIPKEEDEVKTLRDVGETVAQEDIVIAEDGSERLRSDSDLKELLNEIRDFLDSPDFSSVLSSIFDSLFDLLYTDLRPTFFSVLEPDNSAVQQMKMDPTMADQHASGVEVLLPFAKLFPVISRQAHSVLNSGSANTYLDILSNNVNLRAFSVIMYTGWDSTPI